MKPWSKLIVGCLFLAIVGVLSSGRELPTSESDPSTLLSSATSGQDRPDFELVAAPNGTIYLVEGNSRKVMWSCPTGPPIYSSYHLPYDQVSGKVNSTHSYVDYGDDGMLYLHTQDGKLKLNKTIQDYLKTSPKIAKNSEVTVGSTQACVLEIDPLRGKLLKNYGHSGSSSMSEGVANVEFYILRVDHLVRCFAPNSRELWNLTTSVFDAELRCKDSRNLLHKTPLGSSKEHGSDIGSLINSSCWHKFNVHRFYRQEMFDLYLTSNGPEQIIIDDITSVAGQNESPNLVANDDELVVSYNKGDRQSPGLRYMMIYLLNELRIFSKIPVSILLLILLVGYAIFIFGRVGGKGVEPAASKRRKVRKSGKSVSSIEEGLLAENSKQWVNLNGTSSEIGGCVIGRLIISTKEIAKGSNGTVIFEGMYEGRKVAVKRLVKALHDVAFKEVQNLIASDQHPNIVRWHGVEYDKDFVYLVLERCICSLNDLIRLHADSRRNLEFFDGTIGAPWNTSLQDTKLWKSNGYPSTLLLKLMRDVVYALVHLHELGIIHRDIKPQNVLIANGMTLCAKLSDMGISKCLPPDMSSLSQNGTDSGSSGWQAPEQIILHERQTRAVDMFSLGCTFFFCLTGGGHPYGDRLARDFNIVNNKRNLHLVDHIQEAVDLLSCLLDSDPKLRPTAYQVLHHPLFWDSEMRLSFLRDVSDRVELEDREFGSNILIALESVAPRALGTHWNIKMEPAFINNIGHYRRYKYDSVRDLLRVMRNKLSHYRELPLEIQEILGTVPEGFDDYFTSRFPRLMMEVYKVVFNHCRSEKCFEKYFGVVSVPIV